MTMKERGVLVTSMSDDDKLPTILILVLNIVKELRFYCISVFYVFFMSHVGSSFWLVCSRIFEEILALHVEKLQTKT